MQVEEDRTPASRGAAAARAARDDQLVLLASMGQRHADIAAATKISMRQVRRLLSEPENKAKVSELRATAMDRAAGRLADVLDEAVGVLVALMKGDTVQDAVRLGAAGKVLDYGMKLSEHVDLEKRLTALEAAISADAADTGTTDPNAWKDAV